jgi:hypothetical protein
MTDTGPEGSVKQEIGRGLLSWAALFQKGRQVPVRS